MQSFFRNIYIWKKCFGLDTRISTTVLQHYFPELLYEFKITKGLLKYIIQKSEVFFTSLENKISSTQLFFPLSLLPFFYPVKNKQVTTANCQFQQYRYATSKLKNCPGIRDILPPPAKMLRRKEGHLMNCPSFVFSRAFHSDPKQNLSDI